jgi:hypothetical protein
VYAPYPPDGLRELSESADNLLNQRCGVATAGAMHGACERGASGSDLSIEKRALVAHCGPLCLSKHALPCD